MNYLEDLKKIVKINSYTANKDGVDEVGLQMTQWLENIGYSTTKYKRELIGDHLLFKSNKKNGKKILIVFGFFSEIKNVILQIFRHTYNFFIFNIFWIGLKFWNADHL